MGENRDKLEPLSVSKTASTSRAWVASPLSSHTPGPKMEETEGDMAGSEEAST